MVDGLYERYRKFGHAELYRMVQAGKPRQVENVADMWASLADTAGALAAALRRDLARLQPDWIGRASDEYHHRLTALVRYAQMLADEAGAIRDGLIGMAHALAGAQGKAEPPEPAPVLGSTVDAVLGSEVGRVMPVTERQRAHERIVSLVAKLAAEYGVADHSNWPANVPEPPAHLPALAGASTVAGAVTAGLTGKHHHRHHDHGHRGDDRRDRDRRDRDGRHRDRHDDDRRDRDRHDGLIDRTLAVLGTGTAEAGSGWSQPDRTGPVGPMAEHHAPAHHTAGHSSGAEKPTGGTSAGSSSTTPASTNPAASGGPAGQAGGGTPMPMAPMAPAMGGAPLGTGGASGGGVMVGVDPGLSSQQWRAPETIEWAEPEDNDSAPPVLS